MRTYYTYMLLCADGKFYTGVTNDISRREAEHNSGDNPTSWTYPRRPVELVYAEEFQWVQDAIAWEKQLKKWSAAKKRALIARDFDAVHELAKCRNPDRVARERKEDEGGA